MDHAVDFMKLAAQRYSVRAFTNRPVVQETLDQILRAGHLAPTGCNRQPQRILVINSPDAAEKLKKCTACHFGARTALLVCYHRGECWERGYDGKTCGEDDACIVATHMMLEAADLGVGSTWVMHFDPAAVRREYQIPNEIEPVALLVLGYPAPNAAPAAGHTQFRPMDEIVVYDHF